MNSILIIITLIISVPAYAEEWMQPIRMEGDKRVYIGYISVERDRLLDVREKEFNGRYFASETKDGGKRIPLYADWHHITSRIVGLKIKITGDIREMKSGDQFQITTLEILNEK